MAYIKTQIPPNLDIEGLRKWVDEEFRRLAQAYTTDVTQFDPSGLQTQIDDVVADVAANTSIIAAHTTAIAKLTNNQFARVCRVTSNQTVATGQVKVQFNQTDFDPTPIWDGTNFRFKPTIAGYYRVLTTLSLTFAAGTPQPLSELWKNGARVAVGSMAPASGNQIISLAEDIIHFNGTSDYVEAFSNFTAGTTTPQIVAGSDRSWFNISLVKAD